MVSRLNAGGDAHLLQDRVQGRRKARRWLHQYAASAGRDLRGRRQRRIHTRAVHLKDLARDGS